MFVSRCGHGPIAIAGVHGWSGDHRTFRPLLRDLPPEISFWSVDLPGCGRSPQPRNWTFSAIAGELAETLGSFGTRVHVVGNCSGALLALGALKMIGGAAAARFTARFTMIDAFAFWPWYFRLFLAPGWGRYAYASAFANPIGRAISNASLVRHRSASTNLTEGFTRVDHAVTYRYLQILAEVNSPEAFAGLHCPVDILWGENSFTAVKHSVPVWQSVFPEAKQQMLRGAGHLPILEATKQLQQILFEEKPCLA